VRASLARGCRVLTTTTSTELPVASRGSRRRPSTDANADPEDARSFRRHLVRAVALPVLALVALAAALTWQIRLQARAAQWVDYTDRVIGAIQQVQTVVLAAESGVRGYVITHDRSFLAPYEEAVSHADDGFDTLERLLADHALQLQRVRALRALHARWMRYAADVVRREERNARDVSLEEHRVAKQMIDEERMRFRTLLDEEGALRVQRVSRTNQFTRQLVMTSVLTTLVFGVLLAWVTRRELTMLAQSYAHLLAHEKQARRTAEVASQLKDEFLGTVSHELRTPLTAILGWVQMMRSGSVPPDRQPKALEAIQRNAKTQAQLVADLLDMSRLVSGKLRIEVAPVDIARVLDDAIAAVRPAAMAKQISIERTDGDGVSAVMGDAERLQQIFWNLLSNAVKFTPAGGRVRVGLRRVDNQIEVAVSDNGIGIRPALLPQVFQRFWQADSGLTRGHGGLGIGLALVRHLVELHGGTVGVASEGEGCGSTFTVRIPIAPMRIPEKAPLRPRTSHVEHEGERGSLGIDGLDVLVVEDEPDTREIVASILSHDRANVRTAASAREALAEIEKAPPDVIVSDIGMPEMDGYELIRNVRAQKAKRIGDTPAIALTAFAREGDRARALAAGFDLHVAKPIAPDELTAAVARMARRRVSRPKG
jgi:signal transduction histidine kinase/ActR/RegA family two-component response regulator